MQLFRMETHVLPGEFQKKTQRIKLIKVQSNQTSILLLENIDLVDFLSQPLEVTGCFFMFLKISGQISIIP